MPVPAKSSARRRLRLLAVLLLGTLPCAAAAPVTVTKLPSPAALNQGPARPEDIANGKSQIANRDHWAFKPPVRPPDPDVKNKKWPRNAIDRFVLARLEKENLAPSAEADRAALIRRLSLDLLGLPPTPAAVAAFLADESPGAYDRLVERLLASPH